MKKTMNNAAARKATRETGFRFLTKVFRAAAALLFLDLWLGFCSGSGALVGYAMRTPLLDQNRMRRDPVFSGFGY